MYLKWSRMPDNHRLQLLMCIWDLQCFVLMKLQRTKCKGPKRGSFIEDNDQNAEFRPQVCATETLRCVSFFISLFFFSCHVNFLALNQIGAQSKAATTQVGSFWCIAWHLGLLSSLLIKYLCPTLFHCLQSASVILGKVKYFFSS